MAIALGILIPTVLLLFTGHPIALIWSREGGGRQHGDEMDAISSRVQLILLFSASSSTSLSPSCLFSFILALCSTLRILKVVASIEKSTNFNSATVIIGAIDLSQLAVCVCQERHDEAFCYIITSNPQSRFNWQCVRLFLQLNASFVTFQVSRVAITVTGPPLYQDDKSILFHKCQMPESLLIFH